MMKLLRAALIAVLLLLPSSSLLETPLSPSPCYAGDPFEPTDYTGTLDRGALSCTGKPRSC
jgi:hypothetical protein